MKERLVSPEDIIITKQFVTMLMRRSKGETEPIRNDGTSGYIDYALTKGIIEDYDMTNLDHPIERRSAARIVHEVLLREFAEKDETGWSVAEKLLDLYSCRTCVRHIAQVYTKGIMLGREHNVFDLKGTLTYSETEIIVDRMLHREKRIPPREDRAIQNNKIQPDVAWEIMRNDSKSMLIDVRTKEEFAQGHIEGSVCIPLQSISNNPFAVCTRKDTPIILYCQMGYKSSIAAQMLIDAGYRNLYTIPGIEQYSYKLREN